MGNNPAKPESAWLLCSPTSGCVPTIQTLHVHTILMCIAWGFLLPMGAFIARHKWMFGETKVFGKHIWFYLHIGCQLTGMTLFIIAFAWAWSYLPGQDGKLPTGTGTGHTHQVLGTIIMGLASVQVILGFVRPHPEDRIRPYWNIAHHFIGRLTLLAAWAQMYMGIYVAQNALAFLYNYDQWLIPVAVVMGCFMMMDSVMDNIKVIVLRRRAANAKVAEAPTIEVNVMNPVSNGS